jgi:hypothetical protein
VRGVRYTEIGWEGHMENWKPPGLRQCRACIAERRNELEARRYWASPEKRARHAAAVAENARAKRHAIGADAYDERKRRWHANNHVRRNAERAERHAIECGLRGITPRTSRRDETPETIAYRKAYRRRWITEHGPITTDIARLERRRERKREWMRRKRAA